MTAGGRGTEAPLNIYVISTYIRRFEGPTIFQYDAGSSYSRMY